MMELCRLQAILKIKRAISKEFNQASCGIKGVLVSRGKAGARLTRIFIGKKERKVKKGIVVGIVIILGLIGSAAFSDEYDFRKTNWGMSKTEVGEVETAAANEYEGKKSTGWYYNTKVGGLDCSVAYYYIGEKLAKAKYHFFDGDEEDVCIESYEELKGSLIRKYGELIEDEYVWIDDLYRDDLKNWGKAVKQEHLLCYANWETPTTRITIILKGDGVVSIDLEIWYRSKELRKFEEELKEEKILEDF